jgi:hypothetical protein
LSFASAVEFAAKLVEIGPTLTTTRPLTRPSCGGSVRLAPGMQRATRSMSASAAHTSSASRATAKERVVSRFCRARAEAEIGRRFPTRRERPCRHRRRNPGWKLPGDD